jgi:hypothetical protein
MGVILGIFFYFRKRGKARRRQNIFGGEEVKYESDRGELAADGAISELESYPLHPRGGKGQELYELPNR